MLPRRFRAASLPGVLGDRRPHAPRVPGLAFGIQTGAAELIKIGSEDDYDNGAAHCRDLAANHSNMKGAEYQGAYHAWDRIMIPLTVSDPFADEGLSFRLVLSRRWRSSQIWRRPTLRASA